MAELKEKKTNTDQVVAKVVRTVLANGRHATAKTKKRGEISGGGKKPWRQKGTGRARVGSSRSPIWRGGGIVFGPTGVQNFQLKTTKKEKEIARKEAFSVKKSVTQTLAVPTVTKTKEAAKFLKDNNLDGKVLILIDGDAKTDVAGIKRAFRNLPKVAVAAKIQVNAYDVMVADCIAILEPKKASAGTKATGGAESVSRPQKDKKDSIVRGKK